MKASYQKTGVSRGYFVARQLQPGLCFRLVGASKIASKQQ
jgi:hypothetical protein